MPALTAEGQITERIVQELSARFREPEWLRAFRLKAWQTYEQLPEPHPQDETWRWVAPEARDVAKYPVADRAALQVRGPAGGPAVVGDLATALAQQPQLFQSHFMQRAITPADGKLQALHGACMNGAALVYVPRNVRLEQPVRIQWTLDSAERSYFPHLLVVAEEGSQVCVIEEFLSAPDAMLVTVAAAEIFADAGAQVTYGTVQAPQSGAAHFGFQRMLLGRDAQVQSVLLAMGSALARQQIEAIAEAPGSSSELLGFRVGKGDQQCHVVSLQDHRASNTTSNLMFKSALHDAAQASYYGTIRIHKDAQKCSAYQQDRNLLLGEHARANSTPVLEIEADDVRCTHGVSVGPVDDEQLFYLRSRGIPPELAETMLVYGFFEEAIDRIKAPALRELCAQRLAAAVGALDLVPGGV